MAQMAGGFERDETGRLIVGSDGVEVKGGFLRGEDGELVVSGLGFPAAPVTTLPGSPTDGQFVLFQTSAMAALGIMWTLRYRAAASGSYKWDVVNATELEASTAASLSLSTIAAFTSTGVTLALPLAGDYDLTFGAQVRHTAADQGVILQPSATGLVDGTVAAYGFLGQATTAGGVSASIETTYRAAAVSGTVTLKYFAGEAGGTAERCKLRARPIRVG